MNRPTARVPLVLVAVAAVLAATVWFYAADREARRQLALAEARFDAAQGGLEVETYLPPPVAGDRNGAAHLIAGLDRLGNHRACDLSSELRGRAAADWSADQRSRLANLVEGDREALTEFHDAAEMPAIVLRWQLADDDAGPLFELVIEAGCALRLEGVLDLAEGRPAAAEGTVHTLARFGDAVLSEPRFNLLGTVLERTRFRLARDLLAAPGIAAPVLLAAREDLADRRPATRDLLAAQAALDYQRRRELLRSFSEYGAAARVSQWLIETRMRASFAESLHRQADRIDMVDSPYSRWKPALARRERQRRREGLRIVPLFVEPGGADSLLLTLRTLDTVRELARLAVDLRLAAAASGRYPERLPLATSSPADDPLGGAPWSYRRRDSGGAEISAPGATAAVEDYYRGAVNRKLPDTDLQLLTWDLPPPGAGTKRVERRRADPAGRSAGGANAELAGGGGTARPARGPLDAPARFRHRIPHA